MRCASCAGCRHISVSQTECHWYRHCDVTKLVHARDRRDGTFTTAPAPKPAAPPLFSHSLDLALRADRRAWLAVGVIVAPGRRLRLSDFRAHLPLPPSIGWRFVTTDPSLEADHRAVVVRCPDGDFWKGHREQAKRACAGTSSILLALHKQTKSTRTHATRTNTIQYIDGLPLPLENSDAHAPLPTFAEWACFCKTAHWFRRGLALFPRARFLAKVLAANP